MKDVIKASEEVSDQLIWDMSEAPAALGNWGQELPQKPVWHSPLSWLVSANVFFL